MRFKSEERRRGLLLIACSLVLDFALCMAICYFTEDKDQFWTSSFILFLCAEAAIFALAIKGGLWGFIVWHYLGRPSTEDKIYDHFVQRGFPSPDTYERDAASYLDRVRNDDTMPIDVRLAAAAEHGAYDALTGRGMAYGIMIATAYEGAIKRLANK